MADANDAEAPAAAADDDEAVPRSANDTVDAPFAPEASPQRESGVDEVLATAAARQKTFQALRDPGGWESGVRDTRRCDYPLTPVPRVPSARRPASRRGSRNAVADADDAAVRWTKGEAVSTGEPGAEPTRASSAGGGGPFRWRQHVETHVAQMLAALRFRPDELQGFLAAHYPKQADDHGGEEANESSSDEEVVVVDSGPVEPSGPRKKSSIHDISPVQMQRHVSKYLSVKDVYKRLARVGFQLGETLYRQIRGMLLKSVTSGVLDREANAVRLESIFKVELRRQVTIDKLRQVVANDQAAYQKRRRQLRGQRKAERPDSARRPESASLAIHLPVGDDSAETHASAKPSAHTFKMQALERVLASEWRRQDAKETAVPLSDQIDDLIQEKVTAVLYSKNRDGFPFWKDPPQCALSRDETGKLLRGVVRAFAALAVFRTLGVDQLLEVARATRWTILGQGAAVCERGDPMDQLVLVMDGHTVVDSSGSSSSLKGVPPRVISAESSRGDEKRSVDSALDVPREHLGELGLLTKCEVWPSTRRVASKSARLLVLSREAFDGVLIKIYGGAKRLVATRDGAGKRPTSSPAVAGGRVTPRAALLSPNRPVSAVVREEAVRKYKKYQHEYAEAAGAESAARRKAQRPVDDGQNADVEETTIAAVAPSDLLHPRSVSATTSVYQHYPSFPPTTTAAASGGGGGGSAGSHLFRLKCIQPIAFGVKSVEDLIQDEWAPAFPDTSTLVDYMSTVESSFLFEKRNVLIKANLRAVCTSVPFQEDATTRRRADEFLGLYAEAQQQADADAAASAAAPTSQFSGMATGVATSALGLNASALLAGVIVSDGDPMTLGQFADARRRIFGRSGTSSLGGAASPSMRNVLASTSTSATLAKHGHAPFTHSSFVAESSFIDEPRRTRKAEADEDDDHSSEDDDDSAVGYGRRASALTPTHPEIDDEDHNDARAGFVATPPSNPTQARTMALDSLLQTMAAGSATKRNSVDNEAARRVVLQKHINAAKAAAPAASGSRAPLPLRVDLQRRMEAALAALRLKPKAKLDLVLKYTHADFYDRFPDAVVLWEQAAHYISKREHALASLRKFELVASDPRRHFRSLSTHRLAEQKERDALFYQLHYASDLCGESLDELERRCGDAVHVDGRLYRDKMKKDYTELLFEVEQERLAMIYKGIHPVSPQSAKLSPTAHGSGIQRADGKRGIQAEAEGGVVGTNPVSAESRYALATPRESIYVSVADRVRKEEREEHATATPTRTTPPAHHNLSAQVKQHRQNQLDALVTARPSAAHHHHHPQQQARTNATTTEGTGLAAPTLRAPSAVRQRL